MPKIIHVITSPTGGGAEVIVRKLGSQLSRVGLKSEVVYFNIKYNFSKDQQLSSNESLLGIGCRNPLAVVKLRQHIQRELRKMEPTHKNGLIVHAHLTWPFFFVALACIGLNVTLVYTEHSTFNRRRNIPILKYFDRIFYGRYSQIVCISEGVKKSLCDWIGVNLCQRTKVIKNGANIFGLKKRCAAIKTVRFVSVGTLAVRKGFETSLSALSLLEKIDWTYSIVGDGPDRKEFESLASKLKIRDKVNFIGWSNEVERYLQQADIQLVPSFWEGFGLAAVEGMSTGLPIVASNVQGLYEVLDPENPAVFLVDDFKNNQAWLERIVECFKWISKDRERISKAAREQSEKFGFDKMIDEYAELYRDLVTAK